MSNFSLAYQRYQDLVEVLRFQRSTKTWEAEDDRVILEKMVSLEETMCDAEQELLREEGWRSWPDLYAQKMATSNSKKIVAYEPKYPVPTGLPGCKLVKTKR